MSDNEDKNPLTESKLKVNLAEMPIPQFWKDLPELWFKQLKALFKVRRLNNDDSKFNFAIAHLPVDVIATIASIVRKPPENNKYETLRDEVVKRRSMSEQSRIENLLKSTDMGDFTPSDFYRHLEEKAGTCTAVNDHLLKTLWLGRLPDSIRSIVVIREQDNINELIKFADRIYEINRPNYVCNSLEPKSSLKSQSSSNQSEITLLNLQKAIDQLSAKFNREFSNRSRSRNRSNSREYNNRSGYRSQSRQRTGYWLCWYHRKFKERARKCEGCSFGQTPPTLQDQTKLEN